MAKLSRAQRTGAGTVALPVLAFLSLVLMLMLVLGLVAMPSVTRTATDKGAVVELKLPSHRHGDDNPLAPWVEVLSWEPRAFLYHHFLTQEECNHLIELAKPNLVKSTVVDSATGKSKDSRVRTSSGTFLMRGQDDVIKRIEKRIADFTFIPVEQGEGLQVLQYKESEKYEPHYDYFHDAFNTKNGGQRIATVLMYLSNVEQGGETVFPASKVNQSEVPDWDKLSECAQRGISVRPHMGDALLFWSMKPDATLDPTSLHGGCPVIKGTKWSATKWLHVENYLARALQIQKWNHRQQSSLRVLLRWTHCVVTGSFNQLLEGLTMSEGAWQSSGFNFHGMQGCDQRSTSTGDRVAVGFSPATYNLPPSIVGGGYGSAMAASEEEDPKN